MFLRKFIIMSKQALKDVKGHIRLEVRGNKGKISLSVEGLRPRDDIRYKLYALTDEKHGFKEVSLGVIDVDKNARGRLNLNFNPNSINKSQIGINGFNIFLVKEENIEKERAQVILGGYIHKDDGSMSKVKQKREKKSLEKKKPIEERKVETKEKVEEDVKKNVEKKEEIIKKEEKRRNDIQGEKLATKKDLKTRATKDIASKENLVSKEDLETKEEPETKIYLREKDKEESFDPSKTNFKNYYEQLANYTLNLLKFFKQTKPFKDQVQNENFTWWEINQEKLKQERGFLPYYKYISDPPNKDNLKDTDVTCSDQIEKYNKYLFGVSQVDGKITHYIYAIPGRHERSEHPHGGKTGFVTWLEDKNKTRDGYWLIYIDAYTGNVVRPI